MIGYFTLFHENALLGLLYLNLLSIVNYALLIPMVLAFYDALRHNFASFDLCRIKAHFGEVMAWMT